MVRETPILETPIIRQNSRVFFMYTIFSTKNNEFTTNEDSSNQTSIHFSCVFQIVL